MATSRVLRALSFALSLLLTGLFVVSCTTASDPINRMVRDLTLCQSGKRSAARPVTDERLLKILGAVTKGQSPAGGAILCVMPEYLVPYAESATLDDNDKRLTLVIWIERRLLDALDERSLRFVFAHEDAHRIAVVGYPTEERRYYTYCEHMIDRVAAKSVGSADAIHALEQLAVIMRERGAPAVPIAIVRDRIDLLKKHAND